MCHRTRISIPPCQGEEILSALYAVLPAKVNWRKRREPAIHPEGNAIHGLVEGPISTEMGGPVRGVSLLRAPTTANKDTEAYRDRKQNGFL